MADRIKEQAVTEFFMHGNGTPIKIHRWLLAYYGEDTVDISTVHCWIRKSRYSGRHLDLNDQLQSGRPVSATHYLNRQNVDELIQKNRCISQTAIAEKLNFDLPSVNEIIAGLGYKNLCA
jgi:hypothetical protein